MTNEQAFQMIGERAEALAQNPEVKAKAEQIFKTDGMEAAKNYVYMLAICSLAGI